MLQALWEEILKHPGTFAFTFSLTVGLSVGIVLDELKWRKVK